MHNTITSYLSRALVLFSLLSPIGILQAGGTSGSIISDSSETDPNLSSSIPNSTSDFTTETKTSDTGKTLTCVSYTGDPECAGTGNPINVITGNKYQHEIDMPALPGIMGLSLERHYNSLHMGLGQIGYGWRLNYETNLYVISNTIQIVKADGSRVIFNRSILNPNDCACQNPAQGHVMIYPGVKGKEYTWFQLDGTQLHFNHQGKLERISAPTGESTYLTRGLRGELLRVTDPQGRSLIMHYADKKAPGFKGIIAIDTPVGRFEYAHNNDPQSPGVSNLILVRQPTGTDHQTLAHQTLEQHYHYGEADYIAQDMAAANAYPAIPHAAHLLTGISHGWQTKDPTDNSKTISHNKRYRTWAYDNLGRGILSVHGTPKQLDIQGQRKPNTGINQVSLSYQLQAPKQTAKQTASQQNKQSSQQASNKPYPRITRKGEIGTTIITNSLGEQTTYTYQLIAGEYRLHKVIGAGCAECSEANVVYAYDEQARITHITKVKPIQVKPTPVNATSNATAKTTLQGIHTTQTEYDSVGRIKRVADISYINGKAQTPQLKVRYEYPSTPTFPVLKNAINGTQEPHQVTSKPSLIAVPSVIKGKEHQWRITYNDHGQPLKVTETGYAPALPVEESTLTGTTETSATQSADAYNIKQLTRTTKYQYSQINGRSLLSQTDGPLPNGKANSPQDSDITQYQYNQRGEYLTQVIAPNSVITQLSYDVEGLSTAKADTGGTGRVIKSIINHKIAYHYSYNHAGKVTATQRYPASLTIASAKEKGLLQSTEMAYDLLGNATMIKRADGQAVFMQYGSDGKLTQLSDGLGNRVEWKDWAKANHQANETVTTQQWYTADAPDTVARAWYFWRDDQNRLTQRLSPDGGLDTWQYGQADNPSTSQNQWVQHIDPLNRMTLNVLSSQGRAQVRMTTESYIDANFSATADQERVQVAKQTSNSQSLQIPVQIQDDFGRVTQFSSAQHGMHIADYNAANRITHILQPDGTQIDYTYDVAGRLLSKTATAPESKQTDSVQYNYNAFGLSQVKDAVQTLTYKQDLLGREIDKATTLNLKTGFTKTYHIHTRYTVDGKVKAKQLINGDWLVFGLDDKTGLTQAMTIHKTIWPSLTNKLADWLDLPDLPMQIATKEPVVSNIQAHPFNGITRLTHGNGINDDYAFDLAGRLTSVSHSKQLQNNKANSPFIKASYQYDAGRRLISEQISTADLQGKVKEYAYTGWSDFATPPKSGFIKVVVRNTATNSQASSATAAKIEYATMDQAGRISTDANYRYQYNVWGKLASVQNKTNQQSIASYQHNALGERIMASYPTATNNQQVNANQTRYYLYDKQQRIAELDDNGDVIQQYLYVNQTPVAVINTPTAQSQQSDKQSPTGIIAIHTDRRHAPMMATDEQGKIIWQAEYDAWGKVMPASLREERGNPNQSNGANKFNLALRLPGQWQDQATGLYYNYQREYNPETGRYLTPDPLGFPDGADPYAYVNNDPLNKLDPLGLYQIDVHYYMTYFLSVMAGLSEEQALVVAMGAQYIDDNPYTWPLDESGGELDTATAFLGDIDGAVKRLASYHFTQAGYDAPYDGGNFPAYTLERVKKPFNPQLVLLLSAANRNFKGAPNPCNKEQLFGEYLHALQDTFAHRNKENEPVQINSGLGHLALGNQPDRTYNDDVSTDDVAFYEINAAGLWWTRESRAMEMEKETFTKIQQNFAVVGTSKTTNEKIKFDDLIETLDQFNMIRETEDSTNHLYTGSQKLKLLNEYLNKHGFSSIPIYNVTQACQARQNTVVDIAGSSPSGVILGTPLNCPTERGQATE